MSRRLTLAWATMLVFAGVVVLLFGSAMQGDAQRTVDSCDRAELGLQDPATTPTPGACGEAAATAAQGAWIFAFGLVASVLGFVPMAVEW